jgi:hypothetical protein
MSQKGEWTIYKLVTDDNCKRKTLCWPLVIFFNMLDIMAYNTFVIWIALNTDWNRGKLLS